MPASEKYSVRLMPHGESTIYSEREGETFHCGLGPKAEAKILYVDQLKLEERWSSSSETKPLVVWDVGLGAAANAIAVLNSWKEASTGHLHLVSFDHTLGPLKCALEAHQKDPSYFDYLAGWNWDELFKNNVLQEKTSGKSLTWEWKLGNFIEGLKEAKIKKSWPVPYGILYDSYSPARNWEMWKLDHWRTLREFCGDSETVAVSYSRATGARVTFMLAGFYAGRGCPTGIKEETTLIATKLESLREPFDLRWFERVQRSDRSHPFTSETFGGSPISESCLVELSNHPQFAGMKKAHV